MGICRGRNVGESTALYTCSFCSESMAYEEFCPVRVDELLREAHALEDSLIEQKEKLKMRLKMISKTLEML